jgi:hypothetical protein
MAPAGDQQMTAPSFGLALMVAAALLALWILWRYAGFGPKSMLWAAVHAILACAVLRSVPYALDRIGTSGPTTIEYIEIFGIALPALIYGFLSGGWITRVALGLLRR